MRCISPHKGFELCLRNPRITGFTQQGDPIYDGSYLKAEFQQGGVSPWEYDLALKSFAFRGAYEDEDLYSRISWFDTEIAQKHYKWTDEERKFAEERLKEDQTNGLSYIIVEAPKVPAPWAKYDDLKDASEIVALMDATGTEAGDVLSYERQNKNRQAVIDAVEASEDEVPVAEAKVVVKA